MGREMLTPSRVSVALAALPSWSRRATSQRVLPGARLRRHRPADRPPRYHRKTVKTEAEVPVVLGRLLEQAEAGQRPETQATVADLLTQCMTIAELDVSTRETYEGYIRRAGETRPS
jgi:hypothetical protein